MIAFSKWVVGFFCLYHPFTRQLLCAVGGNLLVGSAVGSGDLTDVSCSCFSTLLVTAGGGSDRCSPCYAAAVSEENEDINTLF